MVMVHNDNTRTPDGINYSGSAYDDNQIHPVGPSRYQNRRYMGGSIEDQIRGALGEHNRGFMRGALGEQNRGSMRGAIGGL